jgi:ABC-type uncharacterized transport system involved in gliding motility auxiliary subunit
MSTFFFLEQASMRGFFAVLPAFLTVFIPAITMRLWAEERKLGTISLLLSFPMRSRVLVLGKFVAALVLYLITLACTVTIPVVLAITGDPDWGPVITGYVGTALVGCLFLAVGIFISALFKDQIVAFILSILVCFTMTMLGTDFVATFIDGWVSGLGQVLQKGLGIDHHFAGFERGLIDWDDVVFFLVMTVILLALNSFTLDSKIKLRSAGRFYLATTLLLGIAFVVNLIVSDLGLGRIDLTQGRIYTVSPVTINILSKLDTPVEVNYYVSEEEKMPSALKNIRQDVEDKLSDLARLSTNFKYNIYNPMADADKLKELAQKGIVPFQAQSVERDSLAIKRVYSAISITYLDKKTEVIAQIVPQNLGNLEYELVSNIYRMTLKESPMVSMIAPVEPVDPRYNDPRMRAMLMKLGQTPPQRRDNYQRGMQILRREGYRVSRVALSKAEPLSEDTKTLAIFQPDDLDKRKVYEIQRFLAKGGNVIVAAQSYQFNYAPKQDGTLQVTPRKTSGAVNELLEPYGVQLDSEILMDGNMETLNVSMPRSIGGLINAMVSMPVKLPVQIRVPSQNLNSEVNITNRVSGLLYLWGSALKLDQKILDRHGLKSTNLAESGSSAWTIPFKGTPLSGADLRPGNQQKRKSYVLAVQLEGQFPDTFEGKEIPPWPESEAPGEDKDKEKPEPEKAPAIEKKPGRLIVVGCSQMFANNTLGALDNRLFFQNMIDGVTLTENLIGIRTKSQAFRFIKKLSANQKLLYRFVAVALVPLILAVLGALRFALRRRRRERYEKTVAVKVMGG